MDEVLKRRLVGGIVLLVLLLAVTFFFFSGGEEPATTGVADASLDGTRTYTLDAPQIEDAGASLSEAQPAGTQSAAVDSDVQAPPAAGLEAKPEVRTEEISMADDAGDSEVVPVKPDATPPPVSKPTPAPKPEAKAVKPPPSAVAKPAAKPASKPVSKPATVAVPPASGDWVVQTGSFASQANAESAQKKLNSLGYRSFISKTEGQNPPLYRVRVGPYIGEEAAKTTAAKLRKQLKQDVKVVANR